MLTGACVFSAFAADAAAKPAAKTAVKPAAAKVADTLVIEGRVLEIPGKFPPNDLYNYVYIMKYRVIKVVKGVYAEKDILVGHYNPLIPRSQVKDAKMKKYVAGNVEKFEVGAKHKLTLIKSIGTVWQDAIEDEYFDATGDKYFALKADIAQ